MRLALLPLHRTTRRSVRTPGPTPYERDLWATIRNLKLSDELPPERRSFDRRPPYYGSY